MQTSVGKIVEEVYKSAKICEDTFGSISKEMEIKIIKSLSLLYLYILYWACQTISLILVENPISKAYNKTVLAPKMNFLWHMVQA